MMCQKSDWLHPVWDRRDLKEGLMEGTFRWSVGKGTEAGRAGNTQDQCHAQGVYRLSRTQKFSGPPSRLFHLVTLWPLSVFPMGAVVALRARGGDPCGVMGREGGSKEGRSRAVGHERIEQWWGAPGLSVCTLTLAEASGRTAQMLRSFRVMAQGTSMFQTPHLSF